MLLYFRSQFTVLFRSFQSLSFDAEVYPPRRRRTASRVTPSAKTEPQLTSTATSSLGKNLSI